MSVLTLGVPAVAKEKDSDLDTVTMRMRQDLARMIRTICDNTNRGGKRLRAVDYLDEIIRERVEQDHSDLVARLADLEKARRGKKRKPD